jgi:hypothetical protein
MVLPMPEAHQDEGDPELRDLFERFDGKLVSPGGAAALLGLSRKTIYTLGQRETIRVFHSSKDAGGRYLKAGPKWTLIPLEDLKAYAERVGRPFPEV